LRIVSHPDYVFVNTDVVDADQGGFVLGLIYCFNRSLGYFDKFNDVVQIEADIRPIIHWRKHHVFISVYFADLAEQVAG
jgi:hypothetical protein